MHQLNEEVGVQTELHEKFMHLLCVLSQSVFSKAWEQDFILSF